MQKAIYTATTVLLILFTCQAFGQGQSGKLDYIWGPEMKESKKSTLGDIVAYDQTGMYALKAKSKGIGGSRTEYTLEHYDQNLLRTKSALLDLKNDGRGYRQLEFTMHLKDEIYVFTSYLDRRSKLNYLYVQNISTRTLEPAGGLRVIAKIDNMGRRQNSGDFDYSVSLDTSKVMIYYHRAYGKRDKIKLGVHVFDTQLEEIWSDKVTLPYNVDRFEIEDARVDNDGDVYILGPLYARSSNVSKRRGKPDYKYRIVRYMESNTKKEYNIPIEGKFLTDMKIAVTNDGEIICAGFYSETGTFSIKGSYFLKIDKESEEIITRNFNEFGIDFITQNMTERQEKKTRKREARGKEVELYSYDLDEIILRDDGGAVLVGEQYYVQVTSYTTTDANGNTSTSYTYHYYYNDILITNINPDGEIEWTTKIPKRQATTNDGGYFSSYALAIVDDKMYFVFNDNPKNMSNTSGQRIANFNKSKGSLAVLVEVDANGQLTKKALFSARDASVLTRPKVCKQVSDKEMVLFGERKRKQRFVKVTF